MADMKKQKGTMQNELRKFKGAISEGERQFLMDMSPSMKYVKGLISEEEKKRFAQTK